MEDCFCEEEKEAPGACVSGSHLQPSSCAPWLLLSILTLNVITHAERSPKLSLLHGKEMNPRKNVCITANTKKLYHNP